MYPVLFKIGPFSVYSFGVMQGLGALVATIILYRESKRKNLDIYFTLEVVLLAIFSELVGGKILFLIEHWNEFIAALIIFIILWKNRKKSWADGKLFLLYLILSSISRFLVEFIRLNPKILIGLTEAQLISIVLGSFGLFGFYKLSSIKNNSIEKSPVQY